MISDIRQALRILLRYPAVSAIAVLALALGIGANTAIFSVINAVLLKPLPYHQPDRLVTILQPVTSPISPADFLDIRAQAKSFEVAGATELWSASLTGRDRPEQIIGLRFSQDMFRLLGVAPQRGRTFDASDFAPGKNHVLVIAHGLWQRVFGGAPDAIGKSVLLDGESYTIIGVMPPLFRFAPFWVTQAEMSSPIDLDQRATSRGGNSLRVFARLKPGVAIATAQAEVDQIAHSLEAAYPASNSGRRFAVDSVTEKAVGNVRPALQVLLGAVGMVLLIACANVANLALARATARQREIAVRVSLGAQRSRIVRQFLTESLVLSLTGAIVGLVLAVWGCAALQSMLKPDAGSFRERLSGWNLIGLDLQVLGFTLAIAILTGLLSGLAPAFAASRRDVNSSLKEGARGSTSGRGAALVRRFLVAAEIAVAIVLLAGAGLLVRSFVKLRALDPGFDPRNVISLSISLSGRAGLVGDARESFYRTVVERVQAVPGVQQAALVNHVPLVGDVWGADVALEGRPIAAPGKEEKAVFRIARPGYFSTMRVRLQAGRDFDSRDTAASPPVVIINETLARKQFPNDSPIGKRLTLGDPRRNPRWLTIVGVIGDMKQSRWADPPAGEIYLPFLQSPEFLNGTRPHNAAMMLVTRTAVDASGLIRAVKEAVWSVDQSLPLSGAQTLEHAIGNATWQTRFSLLLIGIFSALALLLAMIGIYGVMAYEVAQRTGEIGIRMALGAGRAQIARMILGQSLPVAIAGIGVGLAAAAALVRLMKTMLFGVEMLDPTTFAVVPLLVLLVAAAAALIPARRAMRVDPITALRED